MGFVNDLERGEEFETKAIDSLNKGGIKVMKNPDKKGMDLIVIESGIEVKKDFYAEKSGNAYIEYECNGKPSGLFKEEEIRLKFWAHSLSPDDFLLFDGEDLRVWVKLKIAQCNDNGGKFEGFRIVKGGDGNRSAGLLVPIQEMEKLSIQCFNI